MIFILQDEDITLDLPEDPAVHSQKQAEPKPIKSIISKSSQDRSSQNKSSFPASTDIWMSQTSQDGAPEKGSDVSTKAGKDAKKDNKKDNKKDKKNTSAKTDGKNSSDAPSVNGSKNSTNSATSKGTKASASSGGAATASGTKQEVPPKDSSKNAKTPAAAPPTAKTPAGSKTGVPSAASSKDTRAPTSSQSATAKTPASPESKNRSKEQMPLSDTKSSKAPIRGAEDHSKGPKTTSGPASGPSVTHSSANTHPPDPHAGQTAPTGTLADLKKQRARRMQDTLASVALKENGKPASASTSNASNGGAVDANDRNANNITPRGSQSSTGSDKPERKYSNAQEVVEGDDHRCCVIL